MGEQRPTCMFCQRKLQAVPKYEDRRIETPNLEGGLHFRYDRVKVGIVGYGYLAEGFFCTLTCGYKYGKRAAVTAAQNE